MYPLAPDYSGAAAALFDLGGIVVMHDASGCTGNYTGFDEPRWLGSRSALYCSGLRRMDAVLGNDEKFIKRTLAAAESIDPTLIAYLGSPVPMVIGTDLKGMAAETESISGIPSFGFETTGLKFYDKGASDVFVALLRRFAGKSGEKSDKKRVNLLGITPLDFGNKGNDKRIKNFFENCGYEVASVFSMGCTVEQIRDSANADMSIVLSRCGLEAAKYLEKQFGIPYICGVPLIDGENFTKKLSGAKQPAPKCDPCKKKILIIHEQVFSNALRDLIREKTDAEVVCASLFGLEAELAEECDINIPDEFSAIEEINSGKYSVVAADPEFKMIIRDEDITLVDIPHAAVSSKLHWDEYPDYLSEDIVNIVNKAANAANK